MPRANSIAQAKPFEEDLVVVDLTVSHDRTQPYCPSSAPRPVPSGERAG